MTMRRSFITILCILELFLMNLRRLWIETIKMMAAKIYRATVPEVKIMAVLNRLICTMIMSRLVR